MSIRLSPKHGVNPLLGVCFVCGKDDGTVVLAGRLKDDAEAPRRAVWSREPCETCHEDMRQGIIFLSVRDGESGDNPYRTGRFAVVRESAVRRMIKEPMLSELLAKRLCFIEDATWRQLGLPEDAA